MSQQRYSPEFKDEAVRQVTERGHSVQEVARRLGVSSHSLYKWVKAVRPSSFPWQNRPRWRLRCRREAIWKGKTCDLPL
jgi:transposase-like protein